jgi:hypothetical protein
VQDRARDRGGALQVDAAVTEPNACSFQRFNRAAQVGIRRLGMPLLDRSQARIE